MSVYVFVNVSSFADRIKLSLNINSQRKVINSLNEPNELGLNEWKK